MHSQLCTHKTLLRTDTSTLLRLDNLSRRAAGNALAPWQLCTRFWLLRACYTELSIYLSVSLSVIGLSMAAPHLLHGATPSTIKTLQARSAGDNHPRPH